MRVLSEPPQASLMAPFIGACNRRLNIALPDQKVSVCEVACISDGHRTRSIMSSSSRASTVEPEEVVELPNELSELSTRIDDKPQSFATGNKDIQLAALKAIKHVFDLGENLYLHLVITMNSRNIYPASSSDRVKIARTNNGATRSPVPIPSSQDQIPG